MASRAARPTIMLLAIGIMGYGANALAQPVTGASPASWSVAGVAAGDVLNMRDVPSGDAKVLVRIPPDARGLKALGCLKKQLALDDWMELSKEARRDAQLLWCRVEYGGQQGWVAGRFLKPE